MGMFVFPHVASSASRSARRKSDNRVWKTRRQARIDGLGKNNQTPCDASNSRSALRSLKWWYRDGSETVDEHIRWKWDEKKGYRSIGSMVTRRNEVIRKRSPCSPLRNAAICTTSCAVTNHQWPSHRFDSWLETGTALNHVFSHLPRSFIPFCIWFFRVKGWNTNWIGLDYAFLGYINADHFTWGFYTTENKLRWSSTDPIGCGEELYDFTISSDMLHQQSQNDSRHSLWTNFYKFEYIVLTVD